MQNIILKAYDAEWQRTHDIESKASSTVGFVGVIFSLTIITLTSIIVSTDEVTRTNIVSSSIYSLIAIFIISSMFLSVFFGIKALSVKGWWFLDADKFLDHCKCNIKSNDVLVEEIFDSYVNGIKTNDNLNRKIASDLKTSHTFFVLSILAITIYFIYILNLI